jgi:hypothetical protein
VYVLFRPADKLKKLHVSGSPFYVNSHEHDGMPETLGIPAHRYLPFVEYLRYVPIFGTTNSQFQTSSHSSSSFTASIVSITSQSQLNSPAKFSPGKSTSHVMSPSQLKGSVSSNIQSSLGNQHSPSAVVLMPRREVSGSDSKENSRENNNNNSSNISPSPSSLVKETPPVTMNGRNRPTSPEPTRIPPSWTLLGERTKTFGLFCSLTGQPPPSPDVSAQFRVLAERALGNTKKYQTVRKLVAGWLRYHPDFVLPDGTCLSDHVTGPIWASWEDYCDGVEKESNPGDPLTLFAAAQALGVRIIILSTVDTVNRYVSDIVPIGYKVRKPVLIGHWGDHGWIALRPVGPFFFFFFCIDSIVV